MELYIGYMLGSLLCFFSDLKKRKSVSIIVILIFCVIAGLSSYSRDYLNYKNLFDNNRNLYEAIINHNFILNPDIRIESGFKLYIAILKLFTNNFNVFLLVYSLTTLIIRFSLYRRVGLDLGLLFLCYISFRYLPNEITQYRSSMASAIVLYSIKNIVDKNLKAYIRNLIIAFFFHKGVIIILPLYFIYLIFLKLKYKTVIFLLGSLFLYKINIFIRILNFIFKDNSHYKTIILNNSDLLPAQIPMLTFCITIIGILFFEKIENEYFKVAVFYMYSSFFCYFILKDIPELAIRTSNYFYDSQSIILAGVFYQIKNKYLKYIVKILLFIFFSIVFYKNYTIIFGEIGYKNIIWC